MAFGLGLLFQNVLPRHLGWCLKRNGRAGRTGGEGCLSVTQSPVWVALGGGVECGGAASWLTNTGKHWTKMSTPRRDGVPPSGDMYSGDREKKWGEEAPVLDTELDFSQILPKV